MSGFQQVLNVRFGGCRGGRRGSVLQAGTEARSEGRSGSMLGGQLKRTQGSAEGQPC